MSVDALREVTRGRGRDRDRRDGGDDGPRRDRPARRDRRPRRASSARGSTSTRRSAPGSRSRTRTAAGSTASSGRTRSRRTCTSCGGCRSARARCWSRTWRRCARCTTRASISTGRRTRPRGSSTWSGARSTRAAASTPSRCSWRCARAAAGSSGRWSTRCSTSRSTPGEAIQARPELELVAPPHTVMVAFRRVGDDARNVAHPPRPVRERRGGDRPHHRRRACRAQAHAAEPEHDTRAESTRCWT